MKKQDLSRLHEHISESERLTDNIAALPLQQGLAILLGALTLHLSQAHEIIGQEFAARFEREAERAVRELTTELDQQLPFED